MSVTNTPGVDGIISRFCLLFDGHRKQFLGLIRPFVFANHAKWEAEQARFGGDDCSVNIVSMITYLTSNQPIRGNVACLSGIL